MSDGRRLEIPKVLVLEDNKSWREQITQLKADLAKFGGHTADCAINCNILNNKTDKWELGECDPTYCGWELTKERWRL